MKTTDTNTEICNSLLRGELSAIETYNQAIEKFAGNSDASTLYRIRADHESSAGSLREIIGENEAKSASGSGPWGVFANAAEGVAILFGESPALTMLQQGEQHGISKYENALADVDLDDSVKRLIREVLLPAQRNHIVALGRCKSGAA